MSLGMRSSGPCQVSCNIGRPSRHRPKTCPVSNIGATGPAGRAGTTEHFNGVSTGEVLKYLAPTKTWSSSGIDNLILGPDSISNDDSKSTNNVVLGISAAKGLSVAPTVGATIGEGVYIGHYAGPEASIASDLGTIAMGSYAGHRGQGERSIAMGNESTVLTKQGAHCVSIGAQSGRNGQNDYTVLMGEYAGAASNGGSGSAITPLDNPLLKPGRGAVAIGNNAGNMGIGDNSAAVGNYCLASGSGINCTFVGNGAGSGFYFEAPVDGTITGLNTTIDTTNKPEKDSVAIGHLSGMNTAKRGTVSIGAYSGAYGEASQENVNIGFGAGSGLTFTDGKPTKISGTIGHGTVSLGAYAGSDNAGAYSISLGHGSGTKDVGDGSICIGRNAAYTGSTTGTVSLGYKTCSTVPSGDAPIFIGQYSGYTDAACGERCISISNPTLVATDTPLVGHIGPNSINIDSSGINAIPTPLQNATSGSASTIINSNRTADSLNIVGIVPSAISGTLGGFYISKLRHGFNPIANNARMVSLPDDDANNQWRPLICNRLSGEIRTAGVHVD